MNIGLLKHSILTVLIFVLLIGAGCFKRSQTREAPEYQHDWYFAEMVFAALEAAQLERESIPPSIDALYLRLERCPSGDVALLREFLGRVGRSGLAYEADGDRYYFYIRKGYQHQGAASFICGTPGKGVRWIHASDEATLLKKLAEQ